MGAKWATSGALVRTHADSDETLPTAARGCAARPKVVESSRRNSNQFKSDGFSDRRRVDCRCMRHQRDVIECLIGERRCSARTALEDAGHKIVDVQRQSDQHTIESGEA